MLKSIELKNFRSHKHSKLEFSKGINVIVGESLNGKTNFIRAIDWVLRNRPAGFDFHSDFAKEKFTEVIIETFDDHSVSLYKDGSSAKYTVDMEVFKGFGQSVPEAVTEALRLTEINIQEQLDKQFLILDTPGEAARVINRVIKMEDIDTLTSAATVKINAENREIQLLESQISELFNQLKDYENLEDVEVQILTLEDHQATILLKENHLLSLRGLVEEFERTQAEVLDKKEAIKDLPIVERCLGLLTDINNCLDILDIVDEATALQNLIHSLKKKSNQALPIYNRVEGLLGQVNILSKRVQSVSDDVASYEALEELIKKEDGNLKILQTGFQSWIKDDLEGRCPFCLHELDQQSFDLIRGLF